MMRANGWTVALDGDGHHKPSTCASCGGPRKKQVVLQTSRREGNITTILRMQMPYCTPCAARVRGAGVRMMVLYSFVTATMIVLPCGAGLAAHELGMDALVAAIAGAGLGLVLSLFAALVLLPKAPSAPATARGEAVSVTRYDGSRRVELFCTNADFAQRLAVANRAVVAPASRLRFVELGAVAWSVVLAVGMIVVFVEAPARAAKEPSPTKPETAASAPSSEPETSSPEVAPSSSAPGAPKPAAKSAKPAPPARKPASPAPTAAPKKGK